MEALSNVHVTSQFVNNKCLLILLSRSILEYFQKKLKHENLTLQDCHVAIVGNTLSLSNYLRTQMTQSTVQALHFRHLIQCNFVCPSFHVTHVMHAQ